MNAPALMKTPLRQVPDVRHLLMNQQARDQLAMVAARHMSPERMMRVVANAIRTTPKLGQCEPMSFLGALMQCAALGLEPNTILGHAYLIPFENKRKGVTEVQVIVGYKGLIDLARRSGHITSLSANIHYSDDELWEYEEGTEARLRHRPDALEGDKLHAYAIAKFRDGGHAYVVMPWAHVMKVRDGSQGYQMAKRYGKKDTPWIQHEDEMAKKTAIRALAKYLPLSVEFTDAMQMDGARADYRTFAMDPTQGVQIEAEDGVTYDAETGEISNDAPADDEPEQEVDPEPETKPARRRSRHELQQEYESTRNQSRKRTSKPVKKVDTAAEDAPEPAAEGPDPEQFQAIVDRIAGDLLDGAPPEELLNDFADVIATMKAQSPGIYRNLVDEITSYAPDLAHRL